MYIFCIKWDRNFILFLMFMLVFSNTLILLFKENQWNVYTGQNLVFGNGAFKSYHWYLFLIVTCMKSFFYARIDDFSN